MSTVEDLAGNNPVALDPAVHRHDKVSSVEFRGASQALATTVAANNSAVFGNLTRFIRIAPDQNIWYDIGLAPVATTAATRAFLAANAVESVPVRPGESIDVLRVSVDGTCYITEDK